jgi:hypothetical protein
MAKKFSLQLADAIKDVENITLDTFRLSVNEAFVSIVAKTPFRDGFAKNSFFSNLGNNNAGEVGREVPDKSGAASIANINATVSKTRLGDSVLIYSNLPYIERLEDGYSLQAPSGMVKTTVAEWPQIVARNSRGK